LAPTITLNNLGKKFGKEWIFRGLNYEIRPGQKLLIQGGNGSGKSTLLQVISGFITPNEGGVFFSVDAQKIDPDKQRNHISLASPYLQLVEDFTLTEMVEHVQLFKPFLKKISGGDFIEQIQLSHAKHKLIKQFSSGMKQRLKLGLALLADTGVVLLDEPVSNLDKEAISWYKNMIEQYSSGRTVIVCSNAITDEHFFCDTELNVAAYKTTAKKMI
jgi:ABC-type multidrug transport system ATPase subunit